MSNYSTDADILEYEPNIKDYGIIDFTAYHTKTTADIQRLLRIEWWPRVSTYSGVSRHFNNVNLEMVNSKLTAAQFTRAAVYHTLAYYILPQLTQHSAEPDRFRMMIDFYKSKFREEFDFILQDGVKYDFDGDGTVQDSEQQAQHFNRLVR
tara:strand:+ start:2181 stop:2633 length:453 start_codon:yes stop_codon:yes gene_type:complete